MPDDAATERYLNEFVNSAVEQRAAGLGAELPQMELVCAVHGALGAAHEVTLSCAAACVLISRRAPGDAEEAAAVLRGSLAQLRSLLGDRHDGTVACIRFLLETLIRMNMERSAPEVLAEAEALAREALVARREMHGDAHALTQSCLDRLARVLIMRRDYDAAAQLMRELLAARRATLGNAHVDTLLACYDLADALLRSSSPRTFGSWPESEQLAREAADGLRATRGAESWEARMAHNLLQRVYQVRLQDMGGIANVLRVNAIADVGNL